MLFLPHLMRDGSDSMVKCSHNILVSCPENNSKNKETVKVIARNCRRRSRSASSSQPRGNLLQASENSNFHEMRLPRGVYPRVKHGAGSEALEGVTMNSYGGLIYKKNFWDTTLATGKYMCIG